jgi:hypothetical protein
VGALNEVEDLREVLDWPLAAIFVDDPRIEQYREEDEVDHA